MADDSIKYEDAESYNYSFDKNKLTFKDIILLHVKKIGEYASVEFRGGYWQEQSKIVNGMGVTDQVYIPDSREVFTNSINYLADMLYPYFDEEMKKAFEKANQKTKEAFQDNTITKEATREDKNPKEAIKIRTFKSDGWKKLFRDEKVEINRVLFRELCCFLFRKKYLEMGAISD